MTDSYRALRLTVDGDYRHSYWADMPSLQVNFSTTAKAPDTLSMVYAENVGPDDTIVFGPAPYEMWEWWTAFEPAPWTSGTALALTRPFYYHPQRGNLLLEVWNYYGSTHQSGAIDATSRIGDSVSSLFGNIGPNTGVFESTVGLVTRFEIIPAPPRPALAIERSGQATLLRWPTNAAGFVLESTPALHAPTQWVTVTNAPVVVGTNNAVTHSLSSPHQFYRLRYILTP